MASNSGDRCVIASWAWPDLCVCGRSGVTRITYLFYCTNSCSSNQIAVFQIFTRNVYNITCLQQHTPIIIGFKIIFIITNHIHDFTVKQALEQLLHTCDTRPRLTVKPGIAEFRTEFRTSKFV